MSEKKLSSLKPLVKKNFTDYDTLVIPSLYKLCQVIPVKYNESDPILNQIYKLCTAKGRNNKNDIVKNQIGLVALACLTQGITIFMCSRRIMVELFDVNRKVNSFIKRGSLNKNEADRFLAWATDNGFFARVERPEDVPEIKGGFNSKFYKLAPPDLVNCSEKGLLEDLVEDRLAKLHEEQNEAEEKDSFSSCYDDVGNLL